MLDTFRALAEPNRLRIFELLASSPLPVGDVATRLGLRQPQASKHLHALSHAGLVEMRPDAQRRIYTVRPQPLRELDAWLSQYRQMWEDQFQRLDNVLREMQSAPQPRKHKSVKSTKPAKRTKR